MTLSELRRKIETREAVIGVIGLGYVGLPVSCAFARSGFSTIGVDLSESRVAAIQDGVSPFEDGEPGLAAVLEEVRRARRLRATTDVGELAEADVVVIAVQTPVDEEHQPRLEALVAACSSVATVLRSGALVVIESTIPPGTIANLIGPLLERATGRRVSEDLYLGHCPERVMPGRLLSNLRGMSRVCGGASRETADTIVALYRAIVDADLDPTDCLTAELVKTAENAYRDVNIAFANELALICEAVGGDVWQVRVLVNKSPGRHMLMPGAGVGGHCIPKDPWLLIANVGDSAARLIVAARQVNESMPEHVVELVCRILEGAGRRIGESRVALLGYSYLENSGLPLNSPSIIVGERLRELGADVVIQDPNVPEHARSVEDAALGSDCVVLLVGHAQYREIDWAKLRGLVRTATMVDARNIVDEGAAAAAGFTYAGLGK